MRRPLSGGLARQTAAPSLQSFRTKLIHSDLICMGTAPLNGTRLFLDMYDFFFRDWHFFFATAKAHPTGLMVKVKLLDPCKACEMDDRHPGRSLGTLNVQQCSTEVAVQPGVPLGELNVYHSFVPTEDGRMCAKNYLHKPIRNAPLWMLGPHQVRASLGSLSMFMKSATSQQLAMPSLAARGLDGDQFTWRS